MCGVNPSHNYIHANHFGGSKVNAVQKEGKPVNGALTSSLVSDIYWHVLYPYLLHNNYNYAIYMYVVFSVLTMVVSLSQTSLALKI